MKLENLTPDIDVRKIMITQPDINRPALQMAGYFDGDKMMKEYAECRVTVTEAFELNWYPGFCRAVFTDAEGKEHIITDKLPVIGIEEEEIETPLPQAEKSSVEIREELSKYLYEETECKPMIIAVVQEV